MGSWRDTYDFPVSRLQKEVGFSESKILWLAASGQLDVMRDVHGELWTTHNWGWYYLTLPNSYRLEQFSDTRDYSRFLKSRGL